MLLEASASEAVAGAVELLLHVLPYFCFDEALKNLDQKHQVSSQCSQLKDVDRTMLCKLVRRNNQTHPCCPGKLLLHVSYFCHFSSQFIICRPTTNRK